MDQIRPWLFIGKYRETRDFPLLSSRGISAMLLLAELVEHDGICSYYLAVEDGEPLSRDLLKAGIDFVVAKREREETILIACGAGISRSAAYAIAALKEIEGLSLVDAFQVVKNAHPEAMPHPTIWNSLCDYFGEPVPWHEIA